MKQPHTSSDSKLYDAIDEEQLVISRAQRRQLRAIAEFDKRALWRDEGCFHMGHWLAARLGITISEGIRRTEAAHALERLPLLSRALETGVLSLEKTVQLARFLTPETEADLIRWARKVTFRTVRDRAILESRRPSKEAKDAHDARGLRFYPLDEIGSEGFEGRLPAEQCATLKNALDRIAAGLVVPEDPRVDDETARDQLYADALVELARSCNDTGSGGLPTVVIHTSIEALRGDMGSQIEGGPVVHPEVARRIACDARLRMVLDDDNGLPVGIGFSSRDIPKWLRSEVRRRDGGCVFPGCGRKVRTHCHHVVPWPDGPTQLDNLVDLCPFHHTLAHEGGWRVVLDEEQRACWFRPDGSSYDPRVKLRALPPDEPGKDDPEIDEARRGPRNLALLAANFR